MRIKKVVINYKKKTFEIFARNQNYLFPFSRLSIPVDDLNPITRVFVDSEIANQGFTIEWKNGASQTVLLDQVLDYARDPEYLRRDLLFKLTVQAQARLKEMGVAKREIIRRMKVTPTQFYRLLDQTNVHKSLDQMLKLLSALDCSIELKVTSKAA